LHGALLRQMLDGGEAEWFDVRRCGNGVGLRLGTGYG
jgi:hypothetical protein